MSDILSQLKSVYDSRKKRQSLFEAQMCGDTATAHMYEALRDGDRVRARQYKIEVYQWIIEGIRCNVKAWKDANNMTEEAKVQIRLHEAKIKEHAAWGRGDKDAVRQSLVEGLRCMADNSRLHGGSNLDIYESQARAYETGEVEPRDLMSEVDATRCVALIRSSQNLIELCRVQASRYVSVISETRENAKLLTAIFQAFSGQFASDQDESVSDRNRAVAVCVQKFLISKVTLYLSFLKTNVNLL
jgi:hypothetical protein